jgi:hypothetical protein
MKKLLLLPALLLGLSACGGTASTPPAPPTIDISGVWVVDLDRDGDMARTRLTLTQNGGSVSGDAEAAYYIGTLVDLYEPFGKLNGNVAGDQYTLNVSASGKYTGSITLSGNLIAGKMSGDWSGVGREGAQASGSFTGVKQK